MPLKKSYLLRTILLGGWVLLLPSLGAALGIGQASGVRPSAPVGDTVVVAVKEAPPFVVRHPGGGWTGLSIELWEEVAEQLNRPYVFRQVTLTEMIDGVAEGHFDVALAALTMTEERERSVDFSYPYYTSGLGVAVREEEAGLVDAFQRLLSPAFLRVVATLTALLFVVGGLVWLFERKRNPEQFGGSAGEGLASGFWWSAVTMTTVGYGDKAPRTTGGRLVALVWMFAALIVASSFTAAMTTALTTSQLAGRVRTVDDLDELMVGAVMGTTGARYLEEGRLSFKTFETPEEALRALHTEEVEAVVYDAPILHHHLQNMSADARGTLHILPQRLTQEYYGIALSEGSSLREPVNQALLKVLDGSAWQDTRYRYLGEE